MNYWLNLVIIFIVGVGTSLGCLVWLHRTSSIRATHRHLLENVILALLTLFLTLMALELFFKLAFAQSDGFRYTLASKNWYARYWQENSLGYRDVEWTPDMLAGKTKVMVVGDSFAAGSGIANPEDRFANQLGRLLGDDYAVMVVASPGWDTIDEIKAIVDYPYRPDILVLSYYINDIEGTAYERGAHRPQIRTDPPAWLQPLVNNSYAFNFLYWRLVRLGPQEWARIYWEEWLQKISADPDIRWQHQQELLTIINAAASEQIPLFVVVFPNLAAIEASQPMTQPVIDLFRAHNVPVLDVGQLLAGRDPADITVNGVDAHPNEAVHREVANQLYRMIIENLHHSKENQ